MLTEAPPAPRPVQKHFKGPAGVAESGAQLSAGVTGQADWGWGGLKVLPKSKEGGSNTPCPGFTRLCRPQLLGPSFGSPSQVRPPGHGCLWFLVTSPPGRVSVSLPPAEFRLGPIGAAHSHLSGRPSTCGACYVSHCHVKASQHSCEVAGSPLTGQGKISKPLRLREVTQLTKATQTAGDHDCEPNTNPSVSSSRSEPSLHSSAPKWVEVHVLSGVGPVAVGGRGVGEPWR